jgi:hypothetical protein
MRGRTYILAIGLIGGLTLGSVAVAAPPSPPIESAKGHVEAALRGWETAIQKQAETRARYGVLEQRINLLKKESQKNTFAGSAELDKLLKESVAADQALRAQDRAVDERAREVKTSVQTAIAALDDTLTALRPQIREGTTESRHKAADAMRALMSLRNELKQVAARVDETASIPREWTRYQKDVEIAPLDGPSELAEKADLAEDQSEKLKKKHEELVRLIQEAKEAQAIARSGAEFRTDVRHFEEETRTGRVTRQQDKSSGGNASLGAFDSNKNAPAAQPAQSAGAPTTSPGVATGGTSDNRGAGGATPPPNQTPAPTTPSPPPQAPSGPRANGTGGSPADGEVGGSGTTPQTSVTPNASDRATPNGTSMLGTAPSASKAFDASPVAKPIDPNVLLNLKVDSLDAGSVDLKTLEAYAKDLEKLDRFLAGRAVELRRKAAEMKASGKK